MATPSASARTPTPPETELVMQLAHDVRSPISAVVALTGSLRDDLEHVLSESHRHQFNLIYNAALQLEYLVSDFIELSRPRDDLVRMEPAEFSVTGVLEGIRDLLQPLAELRNAHIEIRSDAEPDHRLGPPSALSRILLNLAAPTLRYGDGSSVVIEAIDHGPNEVKFVVRSDASPLEEAAVEEIRAVASGSGPRTAACFSSMGLELSFYLADLISAPLDVTLSETGGTTYSLVLQTPPVPDEHPGVVEAHTQPGRGAAPTRVVASQPTSAPPPLGAEG